MDAPDDVRRSLLLGMGGIAMTRVLPKAPSNEGHPSKKGSVLSSQEGEHLIHFRDHGNIFIKVSSSIGSENFAMGTQQITIGAGVPIHRHFHMEESFYVLDGAGFFILEDVPYPIRSGSIIFIPRNAWHGFTNPDHELLLLWIVSPAGLEGFFRETCVPPGQAPRQLTRDQIHQIALKYGTEFR